jgi:hypothetical protein
VVQLNDAAEFITAAIVSVGQNELRVVLCGHDVRLRLVANMNCEPRHKNRASKLKSARIGGMSLKFAVLSGWKRKITVYQGRGAQK